MVSTVVDAAQFANLTPQGSGLTFGNPGPFVGDWEGSVSFPGSGGARLEGPNIYPFTGTAAFTVAGWIKPGTLPASVWPVLVSKEFIDGSGRQSWSITLNDTDGSGTSGWTLGCERWLNGTLDKVTGTTQLQAATVWRHFAVVYTGTNLLAYVDGVQEGTVAATKSMPVSTALFTVGDIPGGFNRPYPGLMAGLYVLSGVALTATDLLRHVAAARRSPVDLISAGPLLQGVQAGRWA